MVSLLQLGIFSLHCDAINSTALGGFFDALNDRFLAVVTLAGPVALGDALGGYIHCYGRYVLFLGYGFGQIAFRFDGGLATHTGGRDCLTLNGTTAIARPHPPT